MLLRRTTLKLVSIVLIAFKDRTFRCNNFIDPLKSIYGISIVVILDRMHRAAQVSYEDEEHQGGIDKEEDQVEEEL